MQASPPAVDKPIRAEIPGLIQASVLRAARVQVADRVGSLRRVRECSSSAARTLIRHRRRGTPVVTVAIVCGVCVGRSCCPGEVVVCAFLA